MIDATIRKLLIKQFEPEEDYTYLVQNLFVARGFQI